MNSDASEQKTAPSKKKFQKVIFDKFTQDGFQKDVNERVDRYFDSNNISKTANGGMVFKTIWILIGWVATYVLVISGLVSPIGMFLLALGHGLSSQTRHFE